MRWTKRAELSCRIAASADCIPLARLGEGTCPHRPKDRGRLSEAPRTVDPRGHIEPRRGRPRAHESGENLLYRLFVSASRIVSMLASSPKDPIHPTGAAGSLNLASAVILNLA